MAKQIVRRGRTESSPPSEFWALRDVSFEIRKGEVLGIIGSNGAGKSTLLKILARVVSPTGGLATVHGRLGALLEVGTGFHPELTGRENIFLNGAILGMKRHEIAAKLDEIVEFAGVERFLDTPIKRYSSGMELRLAFAVAAHIQAEVLVLDEILAVGDAEFQNKCLSRIENISRSGRTVIFVSHQLGTVQRLCTRALLISNGTVAADGPPFEVISAHLQRVDEHTADSGLASRLDRLGQGEVRLSRIEISSPAGVLLAGSPALFTFEMSRSDVKVECSFTIYDELGEAVASFDSANSSGNDIIGPEFRCEFTPLLLVPGRYYINAGLYAIGGVMEDHVERAAMFEVHPGQLAGRTVVAYPGYGHMTMEHMWTKVR
ncbi:ABC transporter ATP-binding protein [Microvirga terrae]|uniref:ABC transporter ATP-binding protein n=1 Tax=Microvirga terrae TaxID=2740529 RepID=A0ABY5RR54_9HYPH|nr:ABC transporter ATP-binding protein [Microvirga terrae]UVF18429.1 ABC transporter ATP-binding protein [Microvirga terrae]